MIISTMKTNCYKLVFLLCLIFFGFSFSVHAGQWIQDKQTGCKIWTNRKNIEGISWSGECRGGSAHGKGGVVFFKNTVEEARFEGEYREGKAYKGVLTSTNGGRAEGHWLNNQLETGIIVDIDGKRFEGVYKNGRKYVGIQKNDEGIFKGEFRNGEPYIGKLSKKGLVNLTGKISNEKFRGLINIASANIIGEMDKAGRVSAIKGIMSHSDGEAIGEFRFVGEDMELTGILITNKEFSRFEGHIKVVKTSGISGTGAITWSDGYYYEGDFENSKPHGVGVLRDPFDNPLGGRFMNGQLYQEAIFPQQFQAVRMRLAEVNRILDSAKSIAAEVFEKNSHTEALVNQAEAAASKSQRSAEKAGTAASNARRIAAEARQIFLTQSKPPGNTVNHVRKKDEASVTQRRKNYTTSPQHQKRKRVALVIGNSEYKVDPLVNPVNDAQDMAAALKKLGFEVIKRTNINKQEMENSVEFFYQRLQASHVGLFFYAGHGVQVEGQNFLLPVDFSVNSGTSCADAKYKAMNAGWVLGKMKDAGNDLNFIILDACRNNSIPACTRSPKRGLAEMNAPKGAIIAYSTSPGEVALDGQGRNSPYTKSILDHISTPGQPIELFFKSVRKQVDKITGGKQTTWESTSLLGDFYFASEQAD